MLKFKLFFEFEFLLLFIVWIGDVPGLGQDVQQSKKILSREMLKVTRVVSVKMSWDSEEARKILFRFCLQVLGYDQDILFTRNIREPSGKIMFFPRSSEVITASTSTTNKVPEYIQTESMLLTSVWSGESEIQMVSHLSNSMLNHFLGDLVCSREGSKVIPDLGPL